jgi:hypothetical protein
METAIIFYDHKTKYELLPVLASIDSFICEYFI